MRQTTWLGNQVQQAVESGMSVLISSLTKAAATEIGGRNLPISFDALGTLHSHCYHALGKPEIAEGREHLQQWNEDEPEYRLSLGSNDLGEKIDGDNLEPALHPGPSVDSDLGATVRFFLCTWKAVLGRRLASPICAFHLGISLVLGDTAPYRSNRWWGSWGANSLPQFFRLKGGLAITRS